MKLQSGNQLVDLITHWVRKNNQANGSAPAEINGDTNLLESGLLDSFGFIELIAFIESQNGYQIDLTDVDPAEFSVVNGLARIAMRNHQ